MWPTYGECHSEKLFIIWEAEVAKWQTRTLEGRVGQPVEVQVLSSAPDLSKHTLLVLIYS